MTTLLFAGIAAISSLVPAFCLDAPPVNPVDQPLVVVRAANGDTIETVLETRQAKALDLDRQDYSGYIPGVEARVDSLRAFIAALAYGKAENIWYCLSQAGSSLANQTGGMGWDAIDSQVSAPLPQVVKWLDELGLDVAKQDLEMRPIDENHARIVISRDAETRTNLTSGSGKPDNGWRDNLNQFVANKNGGLGVWANTRPLLGMLTILTGIDFRSKMNAHNMGVPVSAQIEFYNNKGDLGFDARFNNIFAVERDKSGVQPLLIQTRPDAIIDLNFPTPAGIREMFGLDSPAGLLANIDLLALVPRSMNVTAWRDDAGALHWSLACLMGNKDKFNEQLKRVRHWLEVLAAVSSSAFGIETTRSPFGDELWSVRLGKDAFVMGVVDVETAGKNNAFLVIAETAANWPNPMELKVTPAQDDTLVHWLVTLDDKSRGQLVQALAEVSQERGAKDFNMLFFDKFLPVTDTGWISVEGRSLCAVSTHGLMPALIPGVLEMLKKSISPETHEMRTVAARLRFLLDLAGQARFRGLDLMAEAPERLPGDLSELLFSDSLGKAWLDNEFGKFPGAFHNVTEILSVLAKGEAVDGYQYHIDSGNDGWSVLAENGAGQRLRINAQGIVSAFENGAWVEQVDSLLDFGKYFQ